MRKSSTWRNSDVASLKDVMKSALKEMRVGRDIKARKMESIWRNMTGSTISAATLNVEYYKKKLIITLNNAPLRHELSMGKEKILQQFNRFLDEEDKILEIILR